MWEAYGHFDLQSTEARKVYYLVEQAQAQRAVWINDISLAVFGGDAAKKRLKALTADLAEPTDETLDLAGLADSIKAVSPEQAKQMRKRLEYVEFCKLHGIEV